MARRPSKHTRPARPLGAGHASAAAKADGRWLVRSIPGASAAKTYRCPGCDQVIPAQAASRAGELPEWLLVPYLNDALGMVAVHYASPSDVDTGMALGCRMPRPFDQLAALGPQRALEVQRAVFAETAEPGHRPSPLLEQLAAADSPDLALHTLRTASPAATA